MIGESKSFGPELSECCPIGVSYESNELVESGLNATKLAGYLIRETPVALDEYL